MPGKVLREKKLRSNEINDNVARYRELGSNHLKPQETKEIGDNAIFLLVRTRQSRIIIAQAARTFLNQGESEMSPVTTTNQREGYI